MSRDACCKFYLKQAVSGNSNSDLRTFKGDGSSLQTGDGWFGDAWQNILFPHIVSPILKEVVLPKVKSILGKNITPNIKKGLDDIKNDILSKRSSIRNSLKQRGKETLRRITKQHGGRSRRKKRKKSAR